MQVFSEESFVEVYDSAIYELLNNPEFVTSPRGQKIHEILNAQIVVNNPTCSQIINAPSRETSKKYLAGELLWYFSSRCDLEFIKKYSKFWEKISDDGITCNSAYGNLIFNNQIYENTKYTQWQWCLNSLRLDKDSRQAIMFVSRPHYQYDGNKDFICTLNYLFAIRDNKLYMTVNRRSQDIWLGLTYDFCWESILLQHVRLYLLDVYPELEIGPITISCNSLHLYERNFKDASNLIKDFDTLGNIKTAESIPIVGLPLIDRIGTPSIEILEIIEDGYTDSCTDELLIWLSENS
jgi:thymidylate synthase